MTTPERPLPAVTPLTRDFWTSGASGELRITRCQACRRFSHPPAPRCATCGSRAIEAEAVSGDATLWSFTVNRYPLVPGMAPPYVVAVVELPEQAELRLLTNVVRCEPADLRIGMPLHVELEPLGEVEGAPVFAPVFAPVAER